MKSIRQNQAGFGIWGVILTLAVVAVLIAAGWMAYKKQHDKTADKDTNKTSQDSRDNEAQNTKTADPNAGLKEYSDDNVAFKYPETWTVKDMSHESGPQQWVQLIGPIDDGIKINKGLPTTSDRRIVMTVSPISSPGNCRESCKIYDATSLATVKSNSRLVISDWESQSKAQALEVVDHGQAMVGAETYKVGATINGRQVRIYGSVNYDDKSSFGAIDDVAAFKKTTSFQDLVKIIDSLTVQE